MEMSYVRARARKVDWEIFLGASCFVRCSLSLYEVHIVTVNLQCEIPFLEVETRDILTRLGLTFPDRQRLSTVSVRDDFEGEDSEEEEIVSHLESPPPIVTATVDPDAPSTCNPRSSVLDLSFKPQNLS